MRIDGNIVLRLGPIENFYLIERENHSNLREWLDIETWPYGKTLYCDKWISTACVEGSGAEMIGIAKAIRNRSSFRAKRCAVKVEGDVAFFWSPRNSYNMGSKVADPRGEVPLEVADRLADQIEKELGQ